MKLISLFITAFLTENIVLTKFLGICPLIGTSTNCKKATNMGLAVTIVTFFSCIISYLINKFILIPNDITYMATIIFILIIASLVQISKIIIKNKFKNIYLQLGIYLSLITTNCAVLGTVLLATNSNYNLLEVIIFALGSSLGFYLILYIFSTIRSRLNNSSIPKCLQGFPIALITIGIISIIFMRCL